MRCQSLSVCRPRDQTLTLAGGKNQFARLTYVTALAVWWARFTAMASKVIREISLAAVWQLSRPSSLLVTVVSSLLGLASAAGCGIQPDWAAALAALLLAVMFHAGVNLLQTYYAARQGMPGNPSEDSFVAGHGVGLIRQGVITLAETRQLAWVMLGLVIIAGVALALKAGGGLLLIGLDAALLAWECVVPPMRLGKRGGAEVCAALGWWLVALGADYVQRHHFFVIPAVEAASFALLVATIATAQSAMQNSLTATPGTRQGLSLKWCLAWYLVPMVLAYGWLVGGVALLYQPHQALWGLLSLPLSLAGAGMLVGAVSLPQRARLAWPGSSR